MSRLALSFDIGPGVEVVLETLPGSRVRVSCVKDGQFVGKPDEIPQGSLAAKLEVIHAVVVKSSVRE